MNYRTFPSTGWQVSEIGLGTWQLGGQWGKVDEPVALDILAAAVDRGVNFFDTADIYGAGRSENIIGKFLKSRPGRIYVATKLGRLHGFPDGYSRDLFRRCTEDSLRRLGVDALDLTQLHCIPRAALERGDVFEWLRELRAEGKIQAFGASVESMDEALLCLAQEGLASLQIIFNIFRQKPIDALFSRAAAQGVALIIRLPLASGLLSGRITRATRFAPNDHRSFNRDGRAFNVGETFAGLEFERGLELVEKLKEFVPPGMDMAGFALRWILDHPEVTVVIPGATRPQQAAVNAAASDLAPLPAELHDRLRSFYEREVRQHIRGPY